MTMETILLSKSHQNSLMMVMLFSFISSKHFIYLVSYFFICSC